MLIFNLNCVYASTLLNMIVTQLYLSVAYTGQSGILKEINNRHWGFV